jgi:hypothetical protein
VASSKFRLASAFIRAFFTATLISTPVAAMAQSFEAAVQITGMHLHKIDQAPIGIGARVHYNFRRFAAADMEFTEYPENSSGNFGETAALFGIRAGKRFQRAGFFLKARTGVMHFGGGYFEQRLDQKTHNIADIGGIVEIYPSRRMFLRLDQGDTVIYYGGAHLFNRPNPDPLGTVHHYQTTLGVGFRI